GHFSLFVTNFTQEAHALYRHEGGGWFHHASVRGGILAIGLNFVGFGTGFLSANDRRVAFGLGGATAVGRLTVRWPSGKTQTWEGGRLAPDRYLLLAEGDGKPRRPR